ncbi:innexin inx3-like [Pollicipes pollicipes]|uniref:innexin inx3-like n=1 Tax=Pollicipes pollicipes TaxID=41117 RepID=UPI0018849E12|nr:innexin inx3-like [Pollicipes pollicipes]
MSDDKGGEARHHSYYQWVPFVFALQALTFYMPFTVWKHMSARMGRVNQGLVKAFFVVEFACLLNVIGNIFLLDAFLGVDFGSADTVFPPVAKCTFLKYGYSGTIERIDAVCVLPHNVFNEKAAVSHKELLLPVLTAPGMSRRASQWSEGHRRSTDHPKVTP